MQGPVFKEMPQFKTPEEELDFLRTHMAKRESELLQRGQLERVKDDAALHVIKAYKKVPHEEALHPEHAIEQKDAERIVLRLKPETHDAVMEELLGIVITKGVKNALHVAEKMKNPHIEDDFHRFLVQYFKTGKAPETKEGTPLSKSLHITL